MSRTDLLLEPTLREQVAGFFEPRAEAIDAGCASIREGLAFLNAGVLAIAEKDGQPNADLGRVAETIATVAYSDMSSAFSLWCHRMVMEYLSWAPAGSLPRATALPRLTRTELLGSTALASAMANYLGQAPLPIVAQREGESVVLNGRVSWASNLFPPDFLMVTAASVNDDRRFIVAIPGDAAGLCVDPYPRLLALQATGSSSVMLRDVRLGLEWIVTDDFESFIKGVRPTFLLLQSSFCWGLAHRALTEACQALRGVNEIFQSDLEALELRSKRLANLIRAGLSDHQRTIPIRDLVQLRLDCAQLATAAVALEAKAIGGRGYVHISPTARRLREATFLPIQAPTEGQLRWELSRYA